MANSFSSKRLYYCMARKRRIEFPGAFYHVLARGNNKQRIFMDDCDFESYLDRIRRYKKKHRFNLYAFVSIRHAGHDSVRIAYYLDRELSTISNMICRVEKKLETDSVIAKTFKEVMKVMKA